MCRQLATWLTALHPPLQALTKNGTVLGQYPIRVLPSKTAIVPVNNQYLPRTMEERELCSRTVYAANIDKKVDKWAVQDFFETLCGEGWSLLTGCSSRAQARRGQAQGRDPGNAGEHLKTQGPSAPRAALHMLQMLARQHGEGMQDRLETLCNQQGHALVAEAGPR